MDRSKCDKLFERLYDLTQERSLTPKEIDKYVRLLSASKGCDYIYSLERQRISMQRTVAEAHSDDFVSTARRAVYNQLMRERGALHSTYKKAWYTSAPTLYERFSRFWNTHAPQ